MIFLGSNWLLITGGSYQTPNGIADALPVLSLSLMDTTAQDIAVVAIPSRERIHQTLVFHISLQDTNDARCCKNTNT